MSFAEERAVREGMPVVPMLPHDVLSVLEGRAIVVRMADGGEALVRLYTTDEWLPLQHAAAEEHGAPKVTRARAEELTRPLVFGGGR